MTSRQKVFLWIVIILAVAAAAAIAVSIQRRAAPQGPAAEQPEEPASASPVQPVVEAVKPDQIPEGLPANLPYEKDAQVLQNFTSTNPETGQRQSTRVYVTSKTLQQNFDLFKKFFTDNKWDISNVVDQQNLKSLTSFKNMNQLTILITHADNPSLDTVNITYIYSTPPPTPSSTPAQ